MDITHISMTVMSMSGHQQIGLQTIDPFSTTSTWGKKDIWRVLFRYELLRSGNKIDKQKHSRVTRWVDWVGP